MASPVSAASGSSPNFVASVVSVVENNSKEQTNVVWKGHQSRDKWYSSGRDTQTIHTQSHLVYLVLLPVVCYVKNRVEFKKSPHKDVRKVKSTIIWKQYFLIKASSSYLLKLSFLKTKRKGIYGMNFKHAKSRWTCLNSNQSQWSEKRPGHLSQNTVHMFVF